MFGSMFSSSRGNLSPQEALVLANTHLENARKSDNPNLILAWCADAENALSRIKRSVRKALIPPKSVEDQKLCNGISTVYHERRNLLNNLGYHDKAQASFKMAKEWRYIQEADWKLVYPRPSTRPFSIDRALNPSVAFAFAVMPDQSRPEINDKPVCNNVAQVSPEIFSQDVARPAVKYGLPKPDERIANTPQLAYCLGLLSKASYLPSSPSSSLHAAEPDVPLDEHQRDWILVTTNDADEHERLRSLAKKLIVAFIDDDLKDPSTVAEIMHLVPVLERERYWKLLRSFIDGIVHSTLLDFNLLEGLAQLLQSAAPTYLLADDLVKILDVLSTRLQDTHQQSTRHLYELSVAVSRVLDAMADSNVKGLSREQLHAPLSAYLDGLKNSSDPYLVYQAAYAHQALQYVPDDETPLQSVLRRTRVMVDGVSGVLTSFKNLDASGIFDGLGQLHEGVAEMFHVAQAGFDGASSLINSGEGFVNSLKEGLGFSRKRAWYPALRALDTLLRDGRLVDFKTLVYEAPCRRDPAFEWGLCQRLGEIVANPLWDANTRQSAIEFLGKMYKNDADWGQQASVKQLILTILVQLSNLPEVTIKSHAHTMLRALENNRDSERQALYHACINGPPSSYPLKVDLPPLVSPSLISRVQNIPDVEDDLRMLRTQRLAGRGNGAYIPPQAKASLQASNDALFPLMENVKEFLISDRQVLLLLGDSGAGKSTFNTKLECDLWNSYKRGKGRIPLHINLPAIDKPDKDLITKHLRRNDFTEPQIHELKRHRGFILICDGYDESRQSHNLYKSNQLNQPGQRQAKMVISCRTEYLPQDYKGRFQPRDRNKRTVPKLFQEAVIVPFSEDQIEEYIGQYVSLNKPLWQTKDYMSALDKVPNLLDLVRNPFLLTLSLEVLPQVMNGGRIHDLPGTRITRIELYDEFVGQWLERGKERAGENELSPQAKAAFDTLVDGGFTQTGIDFLKRLAAKIYKEQAGHPIVEYTRLIDKETWKTAFFSRDDETYLLREASPLTRNGNQYRFTHQSLLEYCFTLAVFHPQESRPFDPTLGSVYGKSVGTASSDGKQGVPKEEPVSNQQPGVDHPLAWRSFVGEPSILAFLAERVQQEPSFKRQLQGMIDRSKTDKEGSTAAANAITILVRAGIQFNREDLRDIRIPGADLSGGVFDSAQLQGADLNKVNLRNIWLRQADLSNAQMADVQFGEWPYLTVDSGVNSCAYSPDGKNCAMGLWDGTISVYDTMTWAKLHNLSGHTEDVTSVVYSPDGQKIVSGSRDKTVRLWDAQTGAPGPILEGHTKSVTSVVYSPDGQKIASGSSDETVRLWDAQTGASDSILSGHTDGVMSVVYSPSGQQIASGSADETVRLWDVQAVVPGPILEGHTNWVRSVVYSPNGQQIASGSDDMTVRLWDTQTGASDSILRGHTSDITSVVYSPSGQQVASGSDDTTVRLWDAKTGASGPILSGHTDVVNDVVYSPSGQQIVSGSDDGTVRLWDTQRGASDSILSGHTGSITSVVYSPSGQQIASGSDYGAVRLWDAQTGAPGLILEGHTNWVTNVVYSPNGRQIASGGHDGTVRLWDAQTGVSDSILSGHTKSITSVVYSPSGQQIASGGQDMTVRLWDAQTGALSHILSGHTRSINDMVYSPNGQQIASGSWDWTVRLWDAQTGAPGHILSSHTSWVWSVVYSPSGQRIVSGSDDKTVLMWDVDSGQCLAVVDDFHGPIYSMAWHTTHNGSYFATGCGDKSVRIWQVVEEEGRCHVRLLWSSINHQLTLSAATIQDAQGLSNINMELLKQRGAVGKPVPPSSSLGANENLISMTSTVSQLEMQSNHSMLNILAPT